MKVVTLICLYILLLATLMINVSIASEIEGVDIASIVRGGRLYDNWHKEIKERVPENQQPAYPADKGFANRAENNWSTAWSFMRIRLLSSHTASHLVQRLMATR